jgi:exonuclease SbcC
MRIHRITLKDFGPFTRKTYELSGKMDLVYGPNFSGKTTLANATALTLTGHALTQVKPPDLARAGEQSGTAGLRIKVAERELDVFRSTRGQLQVRERAGEKWEIIASSNLEGQEKIEAAAGGDASSLILTSFLAEGEISAFLTSSPTERKHIFFRLLGIDKLNNALDVFVQARRAAKREEKRLADRVKALSSGRSKNGRPEVRGTMQELKTLEARLAEFAAARVRAEQAASANAELLTERSKLAGMLGRFNGERRQALGCLAGRQELSAELARLSPSAELHDRLVRQREQYVQEIAVLRAGFEELEADRRQLSKMLDQEVRACPTCFQPIDRALIERLIAERQAKAADAAARGREIRAALAICETDLKSAEVDRERIREIATVEVLVRSLDEHIGVAGAQLAEIEAKLASAGWKPEALPSPIEQNKDEAALRARTEARIDALRTRLRNYAIEDALDKQNEAELARAAKAAERATHARLCTEISAVAVENTIQATIEQTLKLTGAQIQKLLTGWNLFRGFKLEMLGERLLPVLSRGRARLDLRQMSASEKMLTYLAMKVALARATHNAGFFVLDDPSLHLDEERTALLAEFLKEIATQDQVVIFSNDARLRELLKGANEINL